MTRQSGHPTFWLRDAYYFSQLLLCEKNRATYRALKYGCNATQVYDLGCYTTQVYDLGSYITQVYDLESYITQVYDLGSDITQVYLFTPFRKRYNPGIPIMFGVGKPKLAKGNPPKLSRLQKSLSYEYPSPIKRTFGHYPNFE